MLFELFIALFLFISAILLYNAGNPAMTELYEIAQDTNAPAPILETAWWVWNHWLYIVIGICFIIIFFGIGQRVAYEEQV